MAEENLPTIHGGFFLDHFRADLLGAELERSDLGLANINKIVLEKSAV
jgi:hypothetical protein